MEHLMISATVKIKAKFDWRGSKRVADVFMEGCVCVFLFIYFFFLYLSLLQSITYSCPDFDNVMEEAKTFLPL